jgi:CheY-like chemotaxis protein
VLRVLIADDVPEIAELIARMVGHLGHHPIMLDEPAAVVDLRGLDVAIIEPAGPRRFAVATTLHEREPDLPMVFASIEPATNATRALAPVAHLEKPFRIADLEEALELARRPVPEIPR